MSITPDEYLEQLFQNLLASTNKALVLTKIGRLYFEPLREPEKAVAYYKQALQEDPLNAEAKFWLAKCLFHDYCDYSQARQLLEESLAIQPELTAALSLLASVLGDLDEPIEERIQILERAVRLAPDWSIPREALARLLISVGRGSEAHELLLQGLKSLRDSPTINDPLEEYYEYAVTGRSVEDIREVFEEMLRELSGKP